MMNGTIRIKKVRNTFLRMLRVLKCSDLSLSTRVQLLKCCFLGTRVLSGQHGHPVKKEMHLRCGYIVEF